MSRLISFVLADSSCLHTKKARITKWNVIAHSGILTNYLTRLLDWHSNALNYWGSDCWHLKVNDIHIPYYVFKQVQSETRNKKVSFYNLAQFKCHSVLQTLSYNKYIDDEVQHGAECMLSRITLCSWWEMNLPWSIVKKNQILYYCFTLQCMIKQYIFLFFTATYYV